MNFYHYENWINSIPCEQIIFLFNRNAKNYYWNEHFLTLFNQLFLPIKDMKNYFVLILVSDKVLKWMNIFLLMQNIVGYELFYRSLSMLNAFDTYVDSIWSDADVFDKWKYQSLTNACLFKIVTISPIRGLYHKICRVATLMVLR